MRWLSEPVLSVEHLTMRFGGLVAVNNLSFSAGRGDITAIISPNGAGKTTVFNCITGFYRPTEGMLTLAGQGRPELPAGTPSRPFHLVESQGGLHVSKYPPLLGHDCPGEPPGRPA